jgi:hypothetical protein
MSEFAALLQPFLTRIQTGEIEVYNEFSLQHELGIFLRMQLYVIIRQA